MFLWLASLAPRRLPNNSDMACQRAPSCSSSCCQPAIDTRPARPVRFASGPTRSSPDAKASCRFRRTTSTEETRPTQSVALRRARSRRSQGSGPRLHAIRKSCSWSSTAKTGAGEFSSWRSRADSASTRLPIRRSRPSAGFPGLRPWAAQQWGHWRTPPCSVHSIPRETLCDGQTRSGLLDQ